MTQATFLWEGDDAEPAVLVRLEGSDAPADIREALESELPGFQDLLALELSSVKTGSSWTGLWLLVSRRHEERLHQNPETWPMLAAVLALKRLPGPDEVVAAAPAVFTPAFRARLGRLLDQAAGQEFPVLRLVPPRRTGVLAFAAALSLLAAANLVLAAWSPGEAAAAAPAALRVVPPQPTALLALAADLPGVQLKAFHMDGAAWHLDLRTTEGLKSLEALKKKVPALRVVQFQSEAGFYRLTVEGDGYP